MELPPTDNLPPADPQNPATALPPADSAASAPDLALPPADSPASAPDVKLPPTDSPAPAPDLALPPADSAASALDVNLPPASPPAPPVPAARPANPFLTGGVLMLFMAVLLLLCGTCSGLFYLLLPLNTKNVAEALQTNVICGSTAAFGLFFGVLLALQGWNGVLGRAGRSAARAFPPIVVLALAFIAAVLLGVGTLSLQPAATYIFPPWHFLAALLPPLTLLAYGAHRLGRSSGVRALLASFSWGAFAATTLAFVFEIATGLVFVVIAAAVILSLPNSQTLLDQIQAQVQQASRTQDFSSLTRYLANPAVVAAVVLYFAGVVPPIEEALKALVVAFINPARTRAADAILWGMAAGAGFAVMENMFNTSIALTTWAPLVLLRVGAAVVHVANGATMGLGWYSARAEKRWGRLLLAYLVSVVVHALWNGTAVLLSSGPQNFPPVVFSAATVLGAAQMLTLVLLGSLGVVWIVYLVSHYSALERSK